MGKTPLVFIPGLFGSMSDKIVAGTGNWSFGLAGAFYEPFVQQLEWMGYERNRTLFIAYYDWRQPIPYAAYVYLAKTIREAKRQTGASKVNVLGHSMGGLVARAYVQSGYYDEDVEQLILLGTPNAGSAAIFSYWTGQQLTHEQSPPQATANAISFYMEWYLNYLERKYPLNRVEAIHRYFPSLIDLVPSQDYGDYLIVNESDEMRFVPYKSMQVKNHFLDELNSYQVVVKNRQVEATVIAGIGHTTPQYLKEEGSRLWRTINSEAGDGNVMVSSVFAFGDDQYLVEGGHMEALFSSYPLLRRKLT
ncbi:lipase family alpha/beta hydrolase [Paenibacillus sp. GCM10027626]|uniref:lipase family alpha/beta hydrolase n=1 Tax=Paenibacillus sp. GCM10027626 TaxID=3273411 RepID=UPI003644EE9A